MKALMSLILALIAITLIMGCSGGKGNPVEPQDLDQNVNPAEVSEGEKSLDDQSLKGSGKEYVEELTERTVAVNAAGFDFPVGDYMPPDASGWTCLKPNGQHFNQPYDYDDDDIDEYHMGEDWNKINGLDANKPVYSVASGILRYNNVNAGWPGGVVVVEHTLPGNIKVNTLYGHLATVSPKSSGQEIGKNETVGTILPNVGNHKSHLHFEIRWGAFSSINGAYSNTQLSPGKLGNPNKQFDPTDFIGNNRSFSSSDGGVVIFNDKFDPGQWHWGTNVNTNKWYKIGQNGYEFGGPGFWYVSSAIGNPAPSLRFGVNDSTNYGNNEGGTGPGGSGKTWGDIAETYPIWVPAETTNLKLVFNELFQTEANYDFCSVDIVYNSESGSAYIAYNIAEYSGDSYGWKTRSIPLDSTGTKGAYCRLRFRFRSNGSVCNKTGWQIDNIKLIANASTSGNIPYPPANIQASDGTYTDKIRITWSSSSGATSYNIYKASSQNGAYNYLANSTSASYNHYVTDTSTYWYKVSALNSYGESIQAGPDSGYKGVSGSPPSPPTNVQASDGTYTDKIRVTWYASSGATIYNIYWAFSQSGTYYPAGQSTSTTYDCIVADNSTLWFKVSASNSYGESTKAGPDSGYKGTSGSPPSQPTNLSASDGAYSSYILLSWSSSSGATQYYIYRATSQYGAYSFYSSTTTNYFYDYVSNTNTYWYKVSARNSYGESSLTGPDGGYKAHGYEVLWSDSITSGSWSNWYAYNNGGSASWYIEDVGYGGSGTKSFRCGIPGGNYGNNENDDIYNLCVVIPPNSRNVCLSLYSRWRVEYNYDFCEIWYSNNGAWTLLDKYGDEPSNESRISKNYNNPDWTHLSYSLPSTYSQSATYQFKFHFTSDSSVVQLGWQIDQVQISRG
jgi:fibronectin type 3 domain-containing protein